MDYATPDAEFIRRSPGHPRMGRTRSMTMDDFRARFGRWVGLLSKHLHREPSAAEAARALEMSVRNLHRWCERVYGRTTARAIREVASERSGETTKVTGAGLTP